MSPKGRGRGRLDNGGWGRCCAWVTPTYGMKRKSDPSPLPFLAPHFLCKNRLCVYRFYFFFLEKGGNIMLAIFSGYQTNRKEKKKKECISPEIASQHCWFATQFFLSIRHLTAKEN